MEIISASAAKEKGLKFYFTGKPCKNGSISPRWVSDRHCSCEKCSSSKYQREFSRKMAVQRKNADAYRARFKKHRDKDPNAYKEKKAIYRLANKPMKRLSDSKRRAMEKNAIPSWFGEFDDLAMKEAFNLAKERESQTGFPWNVDHMVPLQSPIACGLHCATNIQVIPATINLQKHNKMILTEPNEWIINSNSAT